MRKWIELILESTLPNGYFFHASENELAVGTILLPKGKNLLDGDIENILEENRPPNCIARDKAVYMVDNLRMLEDLYLYLDNIYIVKPEQPVKRFDHAWVNAIYSVLAHDDDNPSEESLRKCSRYADAYWQGSTSRLANLRSPPAYEFLAPSATVVERYR